MRGAWVCPDCGRSIRWQFPQDYPPTFSAPGWRDALLLLPGALGFVALLGLALIWAFTR